MSLWKVDDQATAKLMVAFYNHLISGQQPEDALISARDELRKAGASPSQWGAFILLN